MTENFDKPPSLGQIEARNIAEEYYCGKITLTDAIRAADGIFETTQDFYNWIAEIQITKTDRLTKDNPFAEA